MSLPKCVGCKRMVELKTQEMEKCFGLSIALRKPTLAERTKSEQYCCNCAKMCSWAGYARQACPQCRVRAGLLPASEAQQMFDEKVAEVFPDISKWDFGKVKTTLDDVDENETMKSEMLVLHFTSLEAAPLIRSAGFRASPSGQGGGGVYFVRASDDGGGVWERYGERTFTPKYFQGLAGDLFGPGAASRDLSGLQVMIVAAARMDFLAPVPIDDNDPRFEARHSTRRSQSHGVEDSKLVYFSLSKMRDLFDPHDDGFYYLPVKSIKIKKVFRIMP